MPDERSQVPEVGRPAGTVKPSESDALLRLHERLIEKRNALHKLASGPCDPTERWRLIHKTEGFDLALSFVEEARRGV